MVVCEELSALLPLLRPDEPDLLLALLADFFAAPLPADFFAVPLADLEAEDDFAPEDLADDAFAGLDLLDLAAEAVAEDLLVAPADFELPDAAPLPEADLAGEALLAVAAFADFELPDAAALLEPELADLLAAEVLLDDAPEDLAEELAALLFTLPLEEALEVLALAADPDDFAAPAFAEVDFDAALLAAMPFEAPLFDAVDFDADAFALELLELAADFVPLAWAPLPAAEPAAFAFAATLSIAIFWVSTALRSCIISFFKACISFFSAWISARSLPALRVLLEPEVELRPFVFWDVAMVLSFQRIFPPGRGRPKSFLKLSTTCANMASAPAA